MFDDNHMIVRNNYIKHLKYIPNFFKGEITTEPIVKGMYRPLLMASFSFDYFFSGLKPYGYHIINILIHFLNAYVLYLLIKLLLVNISFSLRLGLTLIFCVHPINTETVLYISSRSDALCSLFMALGFYSYLRFKTEKMINLYVLSIILHICALLTKEVGVVFLGLICAYEYVYSKNLLKDFKRIILTILPFMIVTILYFILRRFLFGAMLDPQNLSALERSFWENTLTQASVSFYYIYLFFYPLKICIDHSFSMISGFSNVFGSGSFIAIFLHGLYDFLIFAEPVIGFACSFLIIPLVIIIYLVLFKKINQAIKDDIEKNRI